MPTSLSGFLKCIPGRDAPTGGWVAALLGCFQGFHCESAVMCVTLIHGVALLGLYSYKLRVQPEASLDKSILRGLNRKWTLIYYETFDVPFLVPFTVIRHIKRSYVK